MLLNYQMSLTYFANPCVSPKDFLTQQSILPVSKPMRVK